MSGIAKSVTNWWDSQSWSPAGQRREEDRAKDAIKDQEKIMKAQQAEIATAQAKERDRTLSAAEREKRRKRASTLLTGGMGLMEQPQTALQQLLGV